MKPCSGGREATTAFAREGGGRATLVRRDPTSYKCLSLTMPAAPVSGLCRSRGSKMTLSVLQYRCTAGERHVALMDAEGIAWRLAGIANVRALARAALNASTSLAGAAQAARSDEKVDLGAVTLLAPIDHEDPAHLL